jgi:hypothetical protein
MRIHESSNMRLRSFWLAFVGMLGATLIGFASEIRPLRPDTSGPASVRAAIAFADATAKVHARKFRDDHVE